MNLFKKDKDNKEEKQNDRFCSFYYEEDITNPECLECKEDCPNRLHAIDDFSGIRTYAYKKVKSSLVSKGKKVALTAAYDFTKQFLMNRVASFIMVLTLGFGVTTTVINVTTTTENKQPENTVIVYGDGEVNETSYEEAAAPVEEILEEPEEEIIEEVVSEEGLSNEELFLSISSNSGQWEVLNAYWDYVNNFALNPEQIDFSFPYGISSGALADFAKQYPCTCGTMCIVKGNTAYYAKSPDEAMLAMSEGCPTMDESNYVLFAKVTFEERGDGWYIVADEPCSMTWEEFQELEG